MNDAINLALASENLPENPYEEIARVLKLQTAIKLSLNASSVRRGIAVRAQTVQGHFDSTVSFFDCEHENSQSDPRLLKSSSCPDVMSSKFEIDSEILSSILDFVNETLCLRLKRIDPTDQAEIDRILKEELEKFAPKDSKARPFAQKAVLATSMAISRAGASRKKSALFEHISDIAERTDEKFVIPLPLISMLVGGSKSRNDLAMSEILSCPSGYKTFTEAFEASRQLERSLQIISPQQMGRSETGGFTPFWTRGVDQALSFVHDAMELCKCTDKMSLAMEVSGETFFQQRGDEDENNAYYDLGLNARDDKEEKNSKDEEEEEEEEEEHDDDDDDRVTKQSPDQFLGTMKSWCKKYDIRVVIDPFVTNIDAMKYWSALKKASADLDMKICADSLLRVPEFQLPASLKEGRYHAANFRLTDYVTISDAIKAVCEYQSKNVKVVLDHNTQQQSSYLADFGVALRCNMIHVRGCIGLSQQNVLKRLQSIETESTMGGGGGSKKKKKKKRCKFATL